MRVFLSSTQADLKAERTVVYWALYAAGHEVVRMEDYGSRDLDAWQTCVEELERCDVYVLLIGHRYGSMLLDSGLSYTHSEYERAKAKGIPTLAYIRDGRSAETDPDDALRLQEFIEIVNDEHQVRRPYFRDEEELAKAVRADVQKVKNPPVAPIFYRTPRSLKDPEQYAAAATEQEILGDAPYNVVIADLHVLKSVRYPQEVSARLRQKALQLRADLLHRGVTARLFNEIDVFGSNSSERFRQRVSHALRAEALVVLIQQRGDLALYEQHFAVYSGNVIVCYPSRMSEPNLMSGHLLRFTPDELESCNLVAEVHKALAPGIDEHILTAAA